MRKIMLIVFVGFVLMLSACNNDDFVAYGELRSVDVYDANLKKRNGDYVDYYDQMADRKIDTIEKMPLNSAAPKRYYYISYIEGAGSYIISFEVRLGKSFDFDSITLNGVNYNKEELYLFQQNDNTVTIYIKVDIMDNIRHTYILDNISLKHNYSSRKYDARIDIEPYGKINGVILEVL